MAFKTREEFIAMIGPRYRRGMTNQEIIAAYHEMRHEEAKRKRQQTQQAVGQIQPQRQS